MTIEAVATIGHNRPPSPIEELRGQLATDNSALLDRRDELAAAALRVPEKIETDEIAGRAGDFIKQVVKAKKDAEARRVAAKEPHLEAARAVDGFFKPITDALDRAKAVVQGRLDTFLRLKAEAERRRQQEEAKRLQEEAERLAAAAKTDEGFDAAIEIETKAAAHQERAEAKPAELARTRGDYGSVATLRTTWTFEVLDIAEVPLEILRPHLPISAVEQAIRAFVKAGGRSLKGVRIFEQSTAVVK